MLDGYNRNIDYARISITDNCNMFCKYCRINNEIYTQKQLDSFQIFNLIDVLDDLGFKKIRFTGGEPLLNSNITKYIKYANSKENIKDISITTNGVLLDEYLFEMKSLGLKRINISLDTLNKEKYSKMTLTNYFDRVIKNILLAKKLGFDLKINVVVMKNFNVDEINDFLEFGQKNNIVIRFIELMVIGDNVEFAKKHLYEMKHFLTTSGYKKVELNKKDVADYYQTSTGYVFGVISPMSNHFCQKCNRIRFTSDGKLRMCLHNDNQIDLSHCFFDKNKLKDEVIKNILNKPRKHLMNDNIVARCNMSKIGG